MYSFTTNSLRKICDRAFVLNRLFKNLTWIASTDPKLKDLLKQENYKNRFYFCQYLHKSCANPGIESSKLASNDDKDLQEFNNSYEIICKSVLDINDEVLKDAVNWNIKVLDYNTQGGKKNRGVTVLKAYKILSEENTTDGRIQACMLGWCIEMLQAFFLIHDDIMDNSATRRGKSCWYKKPNVGLTAINDGLLLESNIYKVLEIHFSKTEAYNDLLHEFLQVTRSTVYGQCLDMLSASPGQKPNFDHFNLKMYEGIASYKTARYTFCLPVHLAMHLVGNFSSKDFEATQKLGLKLGLLFQIQDDFLDVFGNPEITGKIGTDISDGKCTWFAATLLEHAPEDIKLAMKKNYGIDDKDRVMKVMKLYEEFGLEEKFYKCEEQLMQDIQSLINNTLRTSSLQTLFQSLCKTVDKRRK